MVLVVVVLMVVMVHCAGNEICTLTKTVPYLLHLLSQKVDVALALATTSDHQAQKCARQHTESAVLNSTRPAPPVWAIEVNFKDLDVNDCK